MSSFYEVLDVPRDADAATIAKAFRKAARRLHPDRNGGVHSPEYLAVAEAYEVLSDESARADYDAELARQEPSPGPSSPSSRTAPRYSPAPAWAPAPQAPEVYVNPAAVPAWVTVVAVVAVLAGGLMHWLAVNIDGQLTIINPAVTIGVLVVAAMVLVALFAGTKTGCLAFLLAAALCWLLYNYLISTPLAWGGTLLFTAGAYTLQRKAIPFYRALRAVRGRRTWGAAGQSQDRTAAHTGGGPDSDGTAHRATAKELDRLLDIPGVRIFHQVHLPSSGIILDHLVLAGPHVAAVVSSRTASSRGHWTAGRLEVGQEVFTVYLSDPVLQEAAALAGASVVMGLVSLSSPGPEVKVDNTAAPDGVFAGSPSWVAHAVRDFLLDSTAPHRVNLTAVDALRRSVV